jgi:hypothetical protein
LNNTSFQAFFKMTQDAQKFQINKSDQMPITENDSAQSLKSARVELKEIVNYHVPEPTLTKETLEKPAPQSTETEPPKQSFSGTLAELEQIRNVLNEARKKAGMSPLSIGPPPKALQAPLRGRFAGRDIPRSSLWRVWDSSTEFLGTDYESAVDDEEYQSDCNACVGENDDGDEWADYVF